VLTARASAPVPVSPLPSPVQTADTEPPIDMAAELVRVREVAQKARKQNFFELLGVPEGTNNNAVKAAYFKMAKLYHPDTLSPTAPPELAQLKAEIFTAIGEANRRLADDKSRAEYLEELKSGGADKVDIAKIFAAEEMFQKACIMVKAKKFADAAALLEEAIKANPEEGEFYAWRGFARFFGYKERPQGLNEALKDIELALKKNPRCAQAHFFHGTMAKLAGDNATAIKQFQKALGIAPDHVEAQRELRALGVKR